MRSSGKAYVTFNEHFKPRIDSLDDRLLLFFALTTVDEFQKVRRPEMLPEMRASKGFWKKFSFVRCYRQSTKLKASNVKTHSYEKTCKISIETKKKQNQHKKVCKLDAIGFQGSNRLKKSLNFNVSFWSSKFRIFYVAVLSFASRFFFLLVHFKMWVSKLFHSTDQKITNHFSNFTNSFQKQIVYFSCLI